MRDKHNLAKHKEKDKKRHNRLYMRNLRLIKPENQDTNYQNISIFNNKIEKTKS